MKNTTKIHILKKIIKENIDAVPESSFDKEATWIQIQKRMLREKRLRKLKTYIIAASVLTIILTSIFITTNDVSALNWFKKIFSQNTTTQIMGGESIGNVNEKSSPNIDIEFNDIKLIEMSLLEARQLTSFNIVTPNYLPEEFVLKETIAQVESGNPITHVILKYSDEKHEIIIREIDTTTQAGYAYGIDNEDTQISEEIVGDVRATLIHYKDDSKKLIIENSDVQFVIDTVLSKTELLNIAESLIQ